VGSEVGRRYAAVSGDRNPIHTSRLAARAFGFRQPIAQGMWSLARCLAALAGRLPDACQITAAFKQPIPLPTTVTFAATGTADGWSFELRHGTTERLHLTGDIVAAPLPEGGVR
jgi:acyl dehydratase